MMQEQEDREQGITPEMRQREAEEIVKKHMRPMPWKTAINLFFERADAENQELMGQCMTDAVKLPPNPAEDSTFVMYKDPTDEVTTDKVTQAAAILDKVTE